MHSRFQILTVIALAGGLALPAMAADAPTKVRQDLMKTVGKATKAGGGMAKGKVAFDAAAAQASLADIYNASLDFGTLFPEGSETGDETEASPKIWSDRAGFDAKVEKFIADSKAAMDSAPADLDAFKAAFGQVASNCKGCHEGYRVKKE